MTKYQQSGFKHALFFAVSFLGSALVHQAEAASALQASCWQEARERGWLVRGPENLEHPGARLWNLSRIASDARKNSQDSCAALTYEKSLADTKKYWEYIGNKYQCQSPEAQSAQCESYSFNQAHIQLIETLRASGVARASVARKSKAPIDDCPKDGLAESSKPVGPETMKTIEDTSAVVAAVSSAEKPEDACKDVPPAQQRKPDESWIDFESTEVCGTTLAKGLVLGVADFVPFQDQLKEKLKDLKKQIDERYPGEWDQLKALIEKKDMELDPSADIHVGIERAVHPKEVEQSLFRSLVADFKEMSLPSFDCYTSRIQVAAICKSIGRGTSIVAGIVSLVGVARKSLQFLKNLEGGVRQTTRGGAAGSIEMPKLLTGPPALKALPARPSVKQLPPPR